MKIYRVKNWSDLFENNRTRDLIHMAWIPIPNKHDGDGYTTLVDRENPAAYLGAWVAILQVASKCDPRGTLLRDAATPHDAASISRITRLPAKIIEQTIEVCINECKWLEVVDDICLVITPHLPALKPHVAADECLRTEGNGMEQNRKEKKVSQATGLHAEFIKGWTENFKAEWGFDYNFNGGMDGKSVKNLLGKRIPSIELLEIAKKAWQKSKQGNQHWSCKQASTISGLDRYLNQIQVELRVGKPESNQIQEFIKIKTIE